MITDIRCYCVLPDWVCLKLWKRIKWRRDRKNTVMTAVLLQHIWWQRRLFYVIVPRARVRVTVVTKNEKYTSCISGKNIPLMLWKKKLYFTKGSCGLRSSDGASGSTNMTGSSPFSLSHAGVVSCCFHSSLCRPQILSSSERSSLHPATHFRDNLLDKGWPSFWFNIHNIRWCRSEQQKANDECSGPVSERRLSRSSQQMETGSPRAFLRVLAFCEAGHLKTGCSLRGKGFREQQVSKVLLTLRPAVDTVVQRTVN